MDQNSATIVIVEDDRDIRTLLADLLRSEGFTVRAAGNSSEMDRILAEHDPDLVILDIMLPGEDGLSICRHLRQYSELPVIMLTARTDDIDRVLGLEIGADDYLCKPFNPRELLARIKAVLRRFDVHQRSPSRTGSDSPRYRCRDLTLDLAARKVTVGSGATLELTTTEFDLFAALMGHAGKVLSRDRLLEATYRRSEESFDRSVDVTVSRLRAKLAGVGIPATDLIKTVRNLGYLFDDTVTPC